MIQTLRIAVLSVAASAIAAAATTYRITLPVAVVLEGQQLEPGDYKVEVDSNTAVLQKGKQKVSSKVHTEMADQKFSVTSVRYVKTDGEHFNMSEMCIGGTKTKLIFDSTTTASTRP